VPACAWIEWRKKRSAFPARGAYSDAMRRTWTLLGPDRKPVASRRRGTLGGHKGTRIFGRLDCPAAQRAIARGGYAPRRVFFLDRGHARAAGYRPCAVCLPKEHAKWKRK
jgi:hypothetical protein